MNWKTIVCRLSALLALALPGCGGSTGGTVGESSSSDDPFIFKLSYFRALPEPKTKKLEPHFRVVMSESWRDRMESPKEPLAKAAPGRIYMGYIPDSHMIRYEKKLRELGLNDLVPKPTETLDPELLGRKAVHPEETSFTRVFTVGTAGGSKSYYYRDQQGKEQIDKFRECEKFIIRACEYAIQVSTRSDPAPSRPR